MVKPSALNPLGYIIQRQYKDSVIIKNKLFSERLAKAKNLYRKDLLAHYGCVNAIEFSEEGELLVSGGDDRRILLWSIPGAIYDKGIPFAMHTTHSSNIFCVAFDTQNKNIFSGGNDDQVLIHETYSGNLRTKIPHRKPVYGLSINRQNDNILATAGDDGRILLFDLRESAKLDVQVLSKQKTAFHSVMFNPTNPRFLVTANSEDGIALWDCRKPREKLLYYDSNSGKISGISACFDSTGKRVLALRRRLPPVLYATQSENALCQFYHPQYYNSCTMKTCCFAGDNDDYILSGSDDFNLYMWKIPPEDCEWGSSHVILRGHRSIVNQVRYNKHNNLVASSGVEKMVKLWSAIPIGTWKGSILKEHSDPTRTVYTHEDYITLVGATGERISHDYSDQSTNEDSKMMAFFDSLIQREIEGWDTSDGSLTSDSDGDTNEGWSKLISNIFRNGRNTSEEPKKHKSNRIAQLISKKRNRLAKMAHNKSSSYIYRCYQIEKNNKRKHSKLKSPPLQKNNGIHKRTPKKSVTDKELRRYKYRTRQSVRDFREQNQTLDAPSTSTGITNSNGLMYRVIEQDSDEEAQITTELCNENNIVEEDNFVNILPTPLNGTHDMFVNVLETTNGTGDDVTIRTEEYTHSPIPPEPQENNISPVTSGDRQRFLQIFTNQESPESNRYSESSDSNYEHDYITPVKRRRSVSASDSGCATGPSSSSSYSLRNPRNHQECFINNNNNNTFQDHSSDEEYKYEKFRKQIKKTKVNIIKQFGHDSDSN